MINKFSKVLDNSSCWLYNFHTMTKKLKDEIIEYERQQIIAAWLSLPYDPDKQKNQRTLRKAAEKTGYSKDKIKYILNESGYSTGKE